MTTTVTATINDADAFVNILVSKCIDGNMSLKGKASATATAFTLQSSRDDTPVI
jgi:hypothetical protein